MPIGALPNSWGFKIINLLPKALHFQQWDFVPAGWKQCQVRRCSRWPMETQVRRQHRSSTFHQQFPCLIKEMFFIWKFHIFTSIIVLNLKSAWVVQILRIGNKFQRPPLSLDNRNKIILESKFYFLKNINNSSPKT